MDGRKRNTWQIKRELDTSIFLPKVCDCGPSFACIKVCVCVVCVSLGLLRNPFLLFLLGLGRNMSLLLFNKLILNVHMSSFSPLKVQS